MDSLNQNYFKTWSRNMAYVLGLWFAVGSLYGETMVDITLKAKDKYILKQVAKELGYEDSIYIPTNKQIVRINFSCSIMYNDIKKITKDFPIIPNEYLSDFIRGYFDGTGKIVNKKGNRINVFFSSKDKKFLKFLSLILKEKGYIKSGTYYENILAFGKRDSILIGQFMYSNNPELFLLRKYKKFQKFL